MKKALIPIIFSLSSAFAANAYAEQTVLTTPTDQASLTQECIGTLSSQAKLASDYAQSQHHQNYILLDKNQAQIIAIKNGCELFRTPIFIGRLHEDSISPENPYTSTGAITPVTPAGVFNPVVWDIIKGKKNDPLERAGSIIPFYCVKTNVCFSMHPDLQTEGEKKVKTAKDMMLSHGCVRIPLEAYEKLAAFIRESGDKNSPVIILPFDQALTRAYIGIPENFENPQYKGPNP